MKVGRLARRRPRQAEISVNLLRARLKEFVKLIYPIAMRGITAIVPACDTTESLLPNTKQYVPRRTVADIVVGPKQAALFCIVVGP